LTEEEARVAAFYQAAMNEEAIDAAGVKPLEPVLAVCKQARDPSRRAEALAILAAQYGVNAFMGLYAGPDKSDSNHSICNFVQSGLGLPDRDYYFDEDKADKRELYKTHIAKMMALLNPELSLEE
jgi:putative endopeptidase